MTRDRKGRTRFWEYPDVRMLAVIFSPGIVPSELTVPLTGAKIRPVNSSQKRRLNEHEIF